MVPYRIRKLPGMTLALLDFYETVFEFWNNNEQCWLSNSALMERANIKSISTIQEAFQYFEKHGEMKRVVKNGKRYLIQPSRAIQCDPDIEPSQSVDNSKKDSSKCDQGIAPAIGGYRHSDSGGIATAIHNNNKLNINKLNKSFCENDQKTNSETKQEQVDRLIATYAKPNPKPERRNYDNDRKHSWANKPEAFSAVNAKPCVNDIPKKDDVKKSVDYEKQERALMQLPPSLRPKRLRNSSRE